MPHPAEGPHTHDLVRGRTTVGDFELTICTDGTYLLDGGAMFGVVPKPLWEKRAPADEKNRILLGANTVIVRTGRHTVAIETGLGNKLSPKLRDIYQVEPVAAQKPGGRGRTARGSQRRHQFSSALRPLWMEYRPQRVRPDCPHVPQRALFRPSRRGGAWPSSTGP